MVRSNLCDYADAYILVKGTITITGAGADAAARQADETGKSVIFKNCPTFKCMSRINSTDIDNAQDIYIVMSMYKFYGSTTKIIQITESESFKSKVKITERILMIVIQKIFKQWYHQNI